MAMKMAHKMPRTLIGHAASHVSTAWSLSMTRARAGCPLSSAFAQKLPALVVGGIPMCDCEDFASLQDLKTSENYEGLM